MTHDQINNLLKRGNSKSYIVALEFQDLKKNKGKLKKQEKAMLLMEAIQNVENAFRKSF